MDDSREMQAVSLKLYQYLCDYVVGSEKVVLFRRRFFDISDELHNNHSACCLFSSGSKTEGLFLPGSDLDLMICVNEEVVYEKADTSKPIHSFFMDDNYTRPGFVNLNILSNNSIQQVSSKEFKDGVLHEIDTELDMKNIFKFHGPSLYLPIFDIDCVNSVECNSWPNIANHWFYRSRISGWPSIKLQKKISQQRVFLVPVGSNSSPDNGDCLVWRLSFSMPEKTLVHSFNHVQLLCYALLKLYLKEVIDTVVTLKKLLCSYYMKTLLFWILEEIPSSYWVPANLIKCFLHCIQRLQYWIQCDYIPNYFIPESNIIEGRILAESRRELISLLDNVLQPNGWTTIFVAESLKDFLSYQVRVRKIKEIDAAIIQLLNYSSVIFQMWKNDHMVESDLKICINRALNRNLSKCERNIHALFFIFLNKFLFMKMLTRIRKKQDNKTYYQFYKKCMFHLLLSTYSDAISGWILLVGFFYKQRKFTDMLQILSHVHHCMKSDMFMIDEFNPANFRDVVNRKHRFKPFLKRIRRETARNVTLTSDMFENDDWMFCDPCIALHYYTFLCYHHLGNRSLSQQSLDALNIHASTIVHKNLYQGTLAYCHLLTALNISGSDNITLLLDTCMKVFEFGMKFYNTFVNTDENI